MANQNSPYQNTIKFLAATHGLSVSALARKVGMQSGALRCYTRQERQPKLKIAQPIADYFGVSVEEVMGLNGPPKDSKDSKDSFVELIRLYRMLSQGEKEAFLKVVVSLEKPPR